MGQIRRASGGGKKWEASLVPSVCLLFVFLTTPPHPRQGTVRLDRAARTAGFRRGPKLGQESLASLQGPTGAVPGLGPSPPPRAFPDSARGREPTGAGGQAGTAAQGDAGGGRLARSIAAGNSGLALSVSAPGLPAAPRPRPRLALSDGDTAGGVLRSLERNREPPGAAGASFPPPRRPGAPRRTPGPALRGAGLRESSTEPRTRDSRRARVRLVQRSLGAGSVIDVRLHVLLMPLS